MTNYNVHGLILGILLLSTVLAGQALADDIKKILPAVTTDGKTSLMQALQERKSTRSFADTELSPQILSDLLWATWGINREDGKHTAPTGMNKQEILVYIALADGIWLYEPKEHILIRKDTKDIRSTLGGGAAILIYAAPKNTFAPFHIGSLYQNAGLYCASINLGNVVRWSPIKTLDGTLPLPDTYKVHMTQAVGHIN